MILQMILKALIEKTCKTTCSRNVENILYPKQVYPIYCQVQSTFKFCLQNHLLKRKDILYFKEMVNGYIRNQSYYKNIKFQNDVHEIYKKLKSHDIKPKQMQKLLNFVNQFVVEIPEPVQTVQHLRVLK